MKNIYLEQDEEIISVVDKIIQSKEDSINLFIPSGAQIWQSSINLKLLKREVDNLNKSLNLVVSDDLGVEMAEKIGFAVKKESDFPVETIKEETETENLPEEEFVQDEVEEIQESAEEKNKGKAPQGETNNQQENKKDMIDFLVDELKPGEEKQETKEKDGQKIIATSSGSEDYKKKMADIVNPKKEKRSIFFDKGFFNKKNEETEIKKEVKIAKKQEQDIFLSQEANESEKIVSRKSFKWSKIVAVFAAIAFIIACLIGYLVLSKAEIIICPNYEKMEFDLSIAGSKNISQVDVSLNKIPLQEIEVSKTSSQEFNSTGEKQLDEKSRGFVTVYNGYSSSPQVLVATTRFESDEGKIFRIPDQITIPGAKINEGKIVPSSIEVEVFADEPGEAYNIDASNFTIPGFKGTAKYAGFYAESNSAMTGGSTKKVRVVSEEDLEKAKEELSQKVKDEVLEAFSEQIPTELKIIESSLTEDIIIVSTVKEGTEADKFTLEIKAIVEALLFREKDVKDLIDLNVISMIAEGKEPLSITQEIKWSEPIVDDNDEILFDLEVKEDIAWKIDTGALKESLTGLKESEVRKYLSCQDKIKEARVSFWPFWVKHMPKQKEKIEITIKCNN